MFSYKGSSGLREPSVSGGEVEVVGDAGAVLVWGLVVDAGAVLVWGLVVDAGAVLVWGLAGVSGARAVTPSVSTWPCLWWKSGVMLTCFCLTLGGFCFTGGGGPFLICVGVLVGVEVAGLGMVGVVMGIGMGTEGVATGMGLMRGVAVEVEPGV